MKPTKIKLELKWNFHILKLKILKWRNYPVTLDISKKQWRSTGGQDNIPMQGNTVFNMSFKTKVSKFEFKTQKGAEFLIYVNMSTILSLLFLGPTI